MKRSLLTAVLMVLLIDAFAQPAVLDQTFGDGGKAKVLKSTRVSAMVQQNNGKTIVASLWDEMPLYVYGTNVNRINVDGSIDTSFHFDTSKSLMSFLRTFEQISSGTNHGFLIYQMAVQSDQKIWAIVHSYKRSNVSGQQMLINTYLCRFSANGMFETITHLPINNIFYDENIYGLTNIVVRPNGNILFGIGGIPPGTQPGSNNLSKLWLYQFKSNGTFDSTFGNNGKVSVNTLGNILQHNISDYFMVYPLVYGIALSNDDRIFVGSANYVTMTSQETVTFMRFSSNGKFDSTYGINGYAQANFGATNFYFDAMALTPQNNGLITGHFALNNRSERKVVGIICFDSTGFLNNSFGTGGKVFATFDSVDNRVNAMQLQKDGKIVLTGYVTGRILNNPLVNKILIARFNRDGTADSLFGKNGVLRVRITPNDYSYTSLIQPDGKIVVAGHGIFRDTSNQNFDNYSNIVRFESTARIYYNTLIASTFLDKNANGIRDANENFVPFGDLLTIKAGADTIRSIFNVDKFLLDIDTGTYVSKIIPNRPYYNIIPATHTTFHTTYFNTDTITFAGQPIPGQRDGSVQLIPLTTARPGFPISYELTYVNKGTDTITTGTIELIKSSKLNFNSASPVPTLINGDTLRWNISNLKPLETGSISLSFTVKTPPLVNNGDTLKSSVAFTTNKTDLTPADNTSTANQIVRGSYDPNDKIENHGGKITTVQIANGDYLQYTIRFQNTGNDTAFNVYIRDTLDNKLDWSTMQILTASHSYQMTMNDGNKCLFTLRNINLVDSNTNERASHGYIVYKLKPKPTVVLGDTIKNTAAIYFDYNLPVITNTETTLIISEVLPLRLVSFIAKKENKTNLLNWTTTNEINVDHFEIERSNNGREFNKIGIVSSELSAGSIHKYSYTDHSPLTAHNSLFYRLKIIDKDGKFEYSPIRMISNNTDGMISIYPNPARDIVTVTHPSTNSIAQLQIIDMTGRILRRTTVAISAVQTNMNIKGLPAGKYNITWSDGLINHTQALVIE